MSLLQALGQAMRTPELRRKLMVTLGLLLVYRVMASVLVPGINSAALTKLFANNSLLGLLNLFSGAGVQTGSGNSALSIVGTGLNPYINATIIMQLLQVSSVHLRELAKEGEKGQMRINQYTRWLTVPLAAVQAVGYTILLSSSSVNALSSPGPAEYIRIIATFTCSTIVLMWLGELITEYGVGQGVSLIIFAGIISQLPSAILGLLSTGGASFVTLVVVAAIAVAATSYIIWVQQATRKIPTQSAQRIVNQRSGVGIAGGRRNFFPLRVNTAGVIPIIFAISLMFFPTARSQALFTRASRRCTICLQHRQTLVSPSLQGSNPRPVAHLYHLSCRDSGPDRQYLRAIIEDRNGMFGVTGKSPVISHHRPLVGKYMNRSRAGIDHGLDRNDKPWLYQVASSRTTIVWHLGRLVHVPPYPMPNIRSHHRKPLSLDILLDSMPNITYVISWNCLRNAYGKCLIGHSQQCARLVTAVATDHTASRVCPPAVQGEATVKANQIAILEWPVRRNTVNYLFIDRNADRLWISIVPKKSWNTTMLTDEGICRPVNVITRNPGLHEGLEIGEALSENVSRSAHLFNLRGTLQPKAFYLHLLTLPEQDQLSRKNSKACRLRSRWSHPHQYGVR